MEQKKNMTYAGVGVDYNVLDAFKRMAQLAGRTTSKNLLDGFGEVGWSRGESAYLIDMPGADCYLAHVEEGLGTKNRVADAMYKLTGKSYYGHVARCTVAMIVNDMITLGARPLSIAMHLAVGESKWFEDNARCADLVKGWKDACNLALCAWGGGETPTLKGIIAPGTVVLSGSSLGVVKPKSRLIEPRIQPGDAIVFAESSGIHANALTLARDIADKLPKGYLTELPDGRTYGETLLDPTNIYVEWVEDCLDRGVDIHYAVNVTGHGWRKLMRAPQPFSYVIERLPTQLPIFDFMQRHGPIDDKEAYGNLNMGAGFALIVPESDLLKTLNARHKTASNAFNVFNAGHVEGSREKKVVIPRKNLEFLGETLQVR